MKSSHPVTLLYHTFKGDPNSENQGVGERLEPIDSGTIDTSHGETCWPFGDIWGISHFQTGQQVLIIAHRPAANFWCFSMFSGCVYIIFINIHVVSAMIHWWFHTDFCWSRVRFGWSSATNSGRLTMSIGIAAKVDRALQYCGKWCVKICVSTYCINYWLICVTHWYVYIYI